MIEKHQIIKRVLCIVSSMDRGGVETFLMKMYRALDTGHYQMDFIVNKRGVYDDEIIDSGGHIFQIPLRTKHPLKSFDAIRQIVKNNKYQYIIKPCNTPIGFFDAFAARLGGARRIIIRSCNSNSDMGTIKKIICKSLMPVFNKIATVKLAPSTEAGQFTFGKKEVEKHNVILLNNGLNTNAYAYNENNRRLKRTELGINDDSSEILVGCIGRFTKQKNHEFLIRVFENIRDTGYQNFKLVLIGDGDLRQVIEKQVKFKGLENQIQFLGNRNDIPELLSAMDLFILTSFYEGMPNVVIEAQTNGLPCIISDAITQEARITDLVFYSSLNDDIKIWTEKIIEIVKMKKVDRNVYSAELKSKGYDISDVKEKFVKLVYED